MGCRWNYWATSKYNLGRMLEDDFSKRFKANQQVPFQGLYPLIQAYDSML